MIGMNALRRRRMIAIQLLLVLPLVATGRFALDLTSMVGDSPAIETGHDNGCTRLHDHELCIQLLRTPWSPSSEPGDVTIFGPVGTVILPADARALHDHRIDLPLARAPPLLT